MSTFDYNKHYKFISDGTWFDKGTECEVEDGNCLWSSDDFTEREFTYEELINGRFSGLFRGVRTKRYESESPGVKIGEKYEDGECCGLDEFEVILR